MKVLVAIVLVATFNLASAGDIQYNIAEAPILFHQFVKTYDRQYKDTADLMLHFGVFITKLDKMNKLNKEQAHATFAINKFADFTDDEFNAMNGFNKIIKLPVPPIRAFERQYYSH